MRSALLAQLFAPARRESTACLRSVFRSLVIVVAGMIGLHGLSKPCMLVFSFGEGACSIELQSCSNGPMWLGKEEGT